MKIIPIPTLHLFPALDEKLIPLLKSLTAEDWNKPTLARLWTVKDIASHLLDGNLRAISMLRDNYFGEKPANIDSYQNLVDFLNQLNADWVKATRRISPALLIDLLESSGKEYTQVLTELDPFQPATFSVAWAGESESLNWFHIAREYTEKWHHQQQLREAVGQPGLMERDFFFPAMDTFMRALPYTYRTISAEAGTAIEIKVSGDAGGKWTIVKQATGWSFAPHEAPVAIVEINPDTAWKLFTKGIAKEEAEKKIRFSGEERLGKAVLNMLSVMA